MRNIKTLAQVAISVLWIASALAVPGLAFAEPDDVRGFDRGPRGAHRGPRGPEPRHFIERHGDELGLDAETREAIQAIADESLKRSERVREEMQAEHEKMRGLLSQSSPDEAAVMSQNARIDALRSQQRSNRLEAMLAIRKLLTPEQREQLIGMRESRRSGRRGEFGARRGFADDGSGGGAGRGKGSRRPMAGCREDIATLCPDAEGGRARLQCLNAEWDNLSDGCRAAFEGRGRRGDRSGGRLDSAPQ